MAHDRPGGRKSWFCPVRKSRGTRRTDAAAVRSGGGARQETGMKSNGRGKDP